VDSLPVQKSTALDLNRPNPSLSLTNDSLKQSSVNSYQDRKFRSRKDSLNQTKERINDLKIKIEDNKNFVTTPPAFQKKNPLDNRTGGFHSNNRASLKLAKIPQRDYKNMTA